MRGHCAIQRLPSNWKMQPQGLWRCQVAQQQQPVKLDDPEELAEAEAWRKKRARQRAPYQAFKDIPQAHQQPQPSQPPDGGEPQG